MCSQAVFPEEKPFLALHKDEIQQLFWSVDLSLWYFPAPLPKYEMSLWISLSQSMSDKFFSSHCALPDVYTAWQPARQSAALNLIIDSLARNNLLEYSCLTKVLHGTRNVFLSFAITFIVECDPEVNDVVPDTACSKNRPPINQNFWVASLLRDTSETWRLTCSLLTRWWLWDYYRILQHSIYICVCVCVFK